MATYLLSFIILMSSLMNSINVSSADPRLNIVARICGDVRVQNVSKYFTYYSAMTQDMQEEMSRNKFALRSFGDPPDRLYLLAQCMNDLDGFECSECITNITPLIPGCFPSAGARAYLDGCFLRADNYSFYAEALTPQDTKRCSGDKSRDEEFTTMVKKVVDQISTEAPRSRGFAVAQETSKLKGISAHGLATCLKTTDRDTCAQCLSNAAAAALSCLPSVEARVLNAGCFLRFSNTSFTNDPNDQTRQDIIDFIIYVVALVLISILAIVSGIFVGKLTYRRKMRATKMKGIVEVVPEESVQFLQFKYATLDKATDSYHENRKLGRGGYGEVYKGTLPDGREIAVKRLFVSGKNQVSEICHEMDIIVKAEHKNLVRFLGGCFTNSDCFLVYEYLPNGSLDLTLFDQRKKKELDWKKRLQIITGTAEGLRYLHKASPVQIIHRDIKASNVLLDMRYRPKISDFGLARLYSGDHQPASNTIIAGTLGYMAPEYIGKGELTDKVDVYSFGILVIEIVTGVANYKYQSEATFDSLASWAWKQFVSNKVEEVVDESLSLEDVEEMKRVVQIGLLCTQESPKLRPSMTNVFEMLKNKNVEIPTPTKPPFTQEDSEFHSFGS